MTIREKNLGVEHPRTAFTYFNLARVYVAQSRFERSELLYLKALAIRERALGKEHPSIQGMLEQYTILLRKMKKEEKANE